MGQEGELGSGDNSRRSFVDFCVRVDQSCSKKEKKTIKQCLIKILISCLACKEVSYFRFFVSDIVTTNVWLFYIFWNVRVSKATPITLGSPVIPSGQTTKENTIHPRISAPPPPPI